MRLPDEVGGDDGMERCHPSVELPLGQRSECVPRAPITRGQCELVPYLGGGEGGGEGEGEGGGERCG